MTDYPLTWLADVLRAAGCRVVEESGWKTRGRPASTGTFRPRAVLRHWDASAPGSHSTGLLINGTGDAPGPLCSIWTCAGNSAHAPSVHVIAAGRCNHGGTGDGWGLIPPDDANTYAVGHEIRQTVDKPWPADQLDQVRRAESAILKKLGEDTKNALCSHSEYAPDRKIDTTAGAYGQSMASERSTVQDYTGTDTPPEGGDVKQAYLKLRSTVAKHPGTGGGFVGWNAEDSDEHLAHVSGEGAVTVLFPAVVTGVVVVDVVSGRVRLQVRRYDTEQVLKETVTSRDLDAGQHSVPFVGSWSRDHRVYVWLQALADDDGETDPHVGLTQLNLTQAERIAW